ncbi:MAG: hypothetical protein ACE37E_09615 [Hyphomicrobiales bacterium]
MADDAPKKPNTKPKPNASDDPRAAALRANLAKRKQQASARRGGKAVGKTEASVFDSLKDGER